MTTKADLKLANDVLLQTNCTLSNALYRERRFNTELALELERVTLELASLKLSGAKPLTRELLARVDEYAANTHH